MELFLEKWGEAAGTSLGLFWTAFWAFGLGYTISAMIQVFVTRERMKRSMGESGPGSVALGTFFGFISSSCSFAALATTRTLFAKGAGLVPSLAFLLSSTNLVIELGIVIAVFLGWQFVVGEYVGAVIMIGLMWLVVCLTYSGNLVKKARDRAREQTNEKEKKTPDWKKEIRSREGWEKVAGRYVMEWDMVWKDVTIGFTVAGVIAAFVPQDFFQALFPGAGHNGDLTFWQIIAQTLVGPLAAFFTFIGSMGNIPLAAVLFGNGVSFAGIMAFIFSDLVVFPVLRIQCRYYGWKMALYILGVFLAVLVCASLAVHYGFAAFDLLPDPANAKSITDRNYFRLDYTAVLNAAFGLTAAIFLIWHLKKKKDKNGMKHGGSAERILSFFAGLSALWLAIGFLIQTVL